MIMVEGKVEEPFGGTVAEWLEDASEGKQVRLAHILSKIGLPAAPGEVRYQLLHRAASAVITVEQYRAVAAVMLVHTFTRRDSGWADYARLLQQYGIAAERGRLQRLTGSSTVPLFAGWVAGDAKFLER